MARSSRGGGDCGEGCDGGGDGKGQASAEAAAKEGRGRNGTGRWQIRWAGMEPTAASY